MPQLSRLLSLPNDEPAWHTTGCGLHIPTNSIGQRAVAVAISNPNSCTGWEYWRFRVFLLLVQA